MITTLITSLLPVILKMLSNYMANAQVSAEARESYKNFIKAMGSEENLPVNVTNSYRDQLKKFEEEDKIT